MRQPMMLQEVRSAYDRCLRRYPTIRMAFEHFCARIEEIAAAEHRNHQDNQAAGAGLDACPACQLLCRQLHHEDLFLAMACARGERIAWEYFSDEYLTSIRRFAQQACRECDAGEDLAQEIVVLLLGECMEPAGYQPGPSKTDSAKDCPANTASAGKLTSYSGRGSLAGWLRAAAAHAAIDRFRRRRKEVSLDAMMAGGTFADRPNGGGMNSVEEGLDARWGPVFSRVLEEEVSRLPARDRLVLGLYYIEGIPLKTIALQFRVHEATASRWLERIRRRLRKAVEGRLRKTHGLRTRDLRVLWQWISSAEELAIESMLQGRGTDSAPFKKVQDGAV